MTDLRSDLGLAGELARRGGLLALEHFRRGTPAAAKADGTVTSAADAAVEELVRAVLAAERPADRVLGEEAGDAGKGARRWIIDPVDGTAQFVRGNPNWATLVALEDREGLAVAVIEAPALGQTWHAVRGGGAFDAAGARLRVSHVDDLAASCVALPDVRRLAHTPLRDAVIDVVAHAAAGVGCESFWPYVLVAAGQADLAAVPIAYPWDRAPGFLLVREAGGGAAQHPFGLDADGVLLANSEPQLQALAARLAARA